MLLWLKRVGPDGESNREIRKVDFRQNSSWTGQRGEEKSGDKKMGKKNGEGSNIPEMFEV